LSTFADALPSGDGNQYPPPPALPWWALMMAIVLLSFLGWSVIPPALGRVVTSILFKLWAVYLCLWIREVRPRATSLYWVCGSLMCDLAMIFFKQTGDQTAFVAFGTLISSLLSLVSQIAAVFIIRDELVRHYNEAEPRRLTLSGGMTFFFSYLYFQFHLRNIAEAKRHETKTLVS